MKTGILLINLGTPDSQAVKDVRKYLRQFLSDPLVIDINPIARYFLVNFIIVPFRAPKSARLYKKTWIQAPSDQPSLNENFLMGSPLMVHSKRLSAGLQNALDSGNSATPDFFIVDYGMRYQNPSIQSAFNELIKKGVEKILAIPLYPQYASSTTGSTIIELKRIMQKENFHNVKILEPFHNEETFINAICDRAKKHLSSSMLISRKEEVGGYDFFLFSYHGLPERHIYKECRKRGHSCNSIAKCESTTNSSFCYRAACYETTRQLVNQLNIPEGKYITAFQSRLSKNWLKPFSDEIIEQKAKEGVKRMLVFSPSFVADCLETIHEIGIEYNEIFKVHGGEKLQLVESLNDSELWVEALKKMVLKNSS